jgi:nucleoid-associated protein YgaU
MIRIVVALFVFAVLLCAWIIYDPFSGGPAEPVTAEAPAAVPDPAIAPTEELVDRLGQAIEVTRSVPEAPPTQPVIREITRVFETPAIRVDDQTLSETTAGVLAGLGLDVRSPAEASADDPMAQMTVGVLSGIRSVTGETEPAFTEPSPLQALVIGALRDGQTDAAIDAAVNEAALAGDLAVPDVMVTSDGRVDTSVLLASIISEARIAAGEARRPASVESVGGDGVEVRVVQTAEETQQYRFYTVNSGDSLDAIAIKFYGDASYYNVIFDANRAILSSPDRIRTGQRLVIPDAS